MKFDLLAKDSQSKARAGSITTDHGVIETPIFMPVGTVASVKGVHQRELKEETGVENVKILKNDIFSLEIICVNGHVKRGNYVPSHVHLNLTYLLEVDENELLKIKADENSGVKWIDINDIETVVNEKWVLENVYKKIIDKL